MLTESLIEKIDTCHSTPEKPFTLKINKHEACGMWLFIFYTMVIAPENIEGLHIVCTEI